MPYRIASLATSANAICLSQTAAGAGALNINGAQALVPPLVGTKNFGVFNMPVTITSTGNLSAVTFTITGTQQTGYDSAKVVSETIAGPNNATVTSANLYNSITSITVSAAVGTAVTVGITATNAASKWLPLNYRVASFNIGVAAVVTGTINYTVNHTFDDVFNSSVTPFAFPHDDTAMVAATTSQNSNYLNPCTGTQIVINSGTGTLTYTVIEDGVRA